MPGMIRRTLLIGGVAAAAGGVALWRWRRPGGGDIAYGSHPRQVMDITYPPGVATPPVLVMIHGGAFLMGDKSDLAVPTGVLEAGIAVARVNYRLSGSDLWPAQAEDCLAAIVHLQRHGASLGVDPARLALLGQSAGAFLAVTTALSLVEVGLPPRAVVSLFGPMDFSTMDADMATLARVSPLGPVDVAESAESRLLGFAVGQDRMRARSVGPVGRLDQIRGPLPPLFIRHGDADPMVADLQSARLRNAWLAADSAASVDFALVPGAGHGGSAFESGKVIEDLLAFLERSLA